MIPPPKPPRFAALFALLTLLPLTAASQSTAPDTLRLGELYQAAERSDPRHRQLRLHWEITELMVTSLTAARRPRLDLSARASYQTETASIPFDGSALPGSLTFPTPPKDQYEVAAEVGQLLYDGGRIATETSLQQYRLAAAQARSGAALPSDEAALEAELVYLNQRRSAAEAVRRAALRRLELLTGRAVAEGDVLATPDLERAAEEAKTELLASNATTPFARRPEFDRFDRARERALAEAEALELAVKPRVSAFARLAAGRPGYDFFDETFRPYAMVGLRAQWAPFDWGATSSRSAAAELQEDVIATEQSAFDARLRREVLDAVYAVERLEAVLASDAHAVALRERIERAALRQLEEGVLLAAEYIAKRNDVFEARLQQRTHLVELAGARVRLLTALGADIPTAADGLREPIAPCAPFEASTQIPPDR